jgi:hypothetical protein
MIVCLYSFSPVCGPVTKHVMFFLFGVEPFALRSAHTGEKPVLKLAWLVNPENIGIVNFHGFPLFLIVKIS